MVVQELLQAFPRRWTLFDLSVGVTLAGLVKRDLGKHFVHRDGDEELTQIVLVGDRKLPLPGVAEEAPKSRLHNIFGAKTGLQPFADSASSHRHEAVDIAVED